PVPVLSNLTYAVVVTNQGPSTATGVVLTNTLPASLTLLSVAPSQGSCSIADGRILCSLGSLTNGASATVSLMTRANAAGTWGATAAVGGTQTEITPADNIGSQTTSVIVPATPFTNLLAIPVTDA